MKPIIVLLLLFIVHGLYAQNTNPWPSSGSVGIGTTSPTALLNVGTSVATKNSNVRMVVGAYSSTSAIQLDSYNDPTKQALFTNENGTLTVSSPASFMLECANDYYGDLLLQTAPGASYTGNVLIPNGRIGIGTLTPTVKLDVGTGGLLLRSSGSVTPNGNAFVIGEAHSSSAKELYLGYDTSNDYSVIQSVHQGTANTPILLQPGGGSVAIGTDDPKGYKLAVNGSMIATSVKVKTYASWPDYVFSPGYRTPSLGELERYIRVNRHLPDLPSAEEVKREGIDLADMNAKLLQKIEELTLYLIEQKKQLDEANGKIMALDRKINGALKK